MKRFHAILLVIIPGMIISGCTGLFGWKNYEGSEQFREDVAVFADYAVQKQFITLYYLKATSDNFSRNMLKGTVSREEYDVFFGKVAGMASHIKEYEAAFKNLEKSGILTSVNTKGIIQSGKNFLSWITGSGENSRERILKVASNLPAEQRTDLYNNLRSEWKGKASGEKDFWNKLEKGDFDNQASQMYNDFYHSNMDFAETSTEKGLTIQKIFVVEGSKGVEAGAELMVDVLQTTTSFVSGPDAGDVGEMTLDIYNASTGANTSEISQELTENINDMDPQDPTVKELGAGYAAKMAAIIKEINDVAKTDAENAPGTNRSFVFVEDDDTESKADIVVAQNPSSTSTSMASIYVTIGNIIDEGEKFIYTILNKGKWLISAVDADGNKSTQEVDVPAGDVILVTLTTTPPVSDDTDDDEETPSAAWQELVRTYSYLSAYPAYNSPFTFVTYRNNDFSYFKGEEVVIRSKKSHSDSYRSNLGQYGFEYFSTNDGVVTYRGPNYGSYFTQIGFQEVSGDSVINFNILMMKDDDN